MKKEKPINLETPPGSFLLVPIAALDYLFETKINITDLAVLNVLCKYRSNKTNMCRPSQTTIGERIHRSRSTVSFRSKNWSDADCEMCKNRILENTERLFTESYFLNHRLEPIARNEPLPRLNSILNIF